MSAYADTSFLVSLYTPDANSVQAARQMGHSRQTVLLTPFGELELTNALELRIFRKELTSSEVRAAHSAFRTDLESGVFSLKPMPATVYYRAKLIARKRTAHLGVRTLDILHVASALALRADTFYTFDRTQGKLAQAEGLETPWLAGIQGKE